MYELYYGAGACSMSVHVALEELGAEYKAIAVDMKNNEHKSDWYLDINPRGQVGTLKTPDGIVTENAAMIVYLNDKHKGDLIPANGYNRALALQWLMFANSSLHPAYGGVMAAKTHGVADDTIKKLCDTVQKKWDLIEDQLSKSGGPFLMGEHFGPGDIYSTVCANWTFLPHLPTFGPKTNAFLETVVARASFQKVMEKEGVQHFANKG